MALVRGANGFVQTMEPWNLKKKGETDQLQATIAVAMEVARVVGVLLQPIVPSFSERMLGIGVEISQAADIRQTLCFTGKLGVSKDERSWEFARFHSNSSEHPLSNQKEVLFPRIKTDSS